MSDEKGWLARMIRRAQEDIKTWPQWMRDAAKMEGSKREDYGP